LASSYVDLPFSVPRDIDPKIGGAPGTPAAWMVGSALDQPLPFRGESGKVRNRRNLVV